MSAVEPLPGVNLPPASLTPQWPVFGIDPSTQRMSLAVLLPVPQRRFVGPTGPVPCVVDTLSLPQRKGAERWAAIQRELVPWLGALIGSWRPQAVFIEQPFAYGRSVPPVSYYAIGVLLAVLGSYRQRVEMIGPGEWKKLALGAGKGAARKPDVLAWARRAAGYEGALEDEADAIGVATAGGVLLEQRKSSQVAA